MPWAPWVHTGRKYRELEDTGGKSDEVLEGNPAAVEAYLACQKGLWFHQPHYKGVGQFRYRYYRPSY